jgi:hypothetical protein
MINQRFITLFLISFSLITGCGLLYWKLLYQQEVHQHLEEQQTTEKSGYKEIDLIIPVQEFLNRGSQSSNLSIVKRAFVNQWIYFNQDDLIKLVMYVQGATTFAEMNKAFSVGIEQVGPKNGAISFIKGMLAAVEKDPELIAHINKSLQEGLSPQIHELRGKIMEVDQDSVEFKKLKKEYRKAFYRWIDDKHGSLLDDLILQF